MANQVTKNRVWTRTIPPATLLVSGAPPLEILASEVRSLCGTSISCKVVRTFVGWGACGMRVTGGKQLPDVATDASNSRYAASEMSARDRARPHGIAAADP